MRRAFAQPCIRALSSRTRSTSSALAWGDSAVVPNQAPGRWCASRLLSEARRLAVADSERDSTKSIGFDLRVAESSIPNSGLGVYAGQGGAIPVDAVVALYSGVYFPLVPLHARAAARGEVVQDVLRMAKLWGYGAVDENMQEVSYEEASSYWLILEHHSGIMDGFTPEKRAVCSRGSPYAVGQMINHPPAGVAPNVDWQEFTWGAEDAGSQVNRLHQGLWYIDPATSEPVGMPAPGGKVRIPVPGVAIVALRDLLPGEELYMNYRFNPPYPPWYTPVSPPSG